MVSEKALEKFIMSGDTSDLYSNSVISRILDADILRQSWIYLTFDKKIINIASVYDPDSDWFRLLSYYFWNEVVDKDKNFTPYFENHISVFFLEESNSIEIFSAEATNIPIIFESDFVKVLLQNMKKGTLIDYKFESNDELTNVVFNKYPKYKIVK